MESPGSHRALIKALGGPIKLAKDLGIYRPIPTTLHWASRGIPPRYWHRIVTLANRKGIKITAHDLETLETDGCTGLMPEAAD